MDETQTNWADTVQGWGTTLLDRWSAKQFAQPVPVANTSIGPNGRAYVDGQPNMQTMKVGGMTVSPLMLAAGAAAIVALVVVTRKG